jgi:hypothetical protein
MAMQRVGDDSAGFSVEHLAQDRTVVKAWGFWSVAVAAAFETTLVGACAGRPKGGALTLDMSELKPMREEGQQAVSQVLRALPALGFQRVSVVTTNPLTKLQLVRLAAESRAGTGIEWIAGTNELGRTF